MKPLIAAGAALLVSFSAQAEIVTFDYTGFINEVREREAGATRTRGVAVTTWTPAPLAVGATFHGSFTFDTSAPLGAASSGSASYLSVPLAAGAPASVRFGDGWRIDAHPFSPTAHVGNGPAAAGGDWFSFWYSTPSPTYLTFSVQDRSGAALSGTALPSDLDFDSFSQTGLDFAWLSANGGTVLVHGSLSSITRVTPVPEPATYGMLLAGALVVGAAARRRARAIRSPR